MFNRFDVLSDMHCSTQIFILIIINVEYSLKNAMNLCQQPNIFVVAVNQR